MSVADDLLDAVVRAPEDLAARALLGDALAERGDPRGEFIAVQLALASDLRGARYVELVARERELLAAHGAAWTAGFPPGKYRFAQGFAERAEVGLDAWLARGASVLARTPLRALTLVPTSGAEALARASFRAVSELSLFFTVGDAEAAALARNPSVASVRSLDVWQADLSVDGARALATCPHLAGVERVKVGSGGRFFAMDGLAVLLATRAFPACTSFALARTAIGADAAATIASSPGVNARDELRLEEVEIPPRSLALLLASPPFRAVTRLALDGEYLAPACAAALAGTGLLAGLASLEVYPTSLGGSSHRRGSDRAHDPRALLADVAREARALRALGVGGSSQVVAAAMDSALLSRLDALELRRVPLTGALVEELGARAPGVRRLALRNAEVDRDVVAALVGGAWAHLEALDLRRVYDVSPDDVAALHARFGASVQLGWEWHPPAPVVSVPEPR